ncbi:MAG TPA: tetratricopeptide repeat protein [Kofleriaceae bacterium]|nr:tetratricopeptide repeat protein [Kofleriaceae bacterium]
MDTARKFVEKNQIDKAVKEYLRIVHEDPKDVRVWLKIGDLYAKKGAKQDATDTYLKVARFYDEQGFYLKAVAVYKQILKINPHLVDVILKLAELHRRLGLMSDAMQHYEAVAAHFHREGKTKEALETVQKLVELDPENIATRIKLAELYSKEGVVDEAVQQFTLACEQLRRQGRQDDFIKVAERLLWHKPELHQLHRELAGLYLRRNDPRRALQKLQACFKADPRDAETLGLLALAFQALDQKSKTVSVLKELARIHVENKARDKAAEVYRKILEIVPGDADAVQYLGPAASQPRPTPPPSPSRPVTPIPAAVRAATADAKFNITGDLPAMPPSTRMTGSMPLVDAESLSGVDFALPEYDGDDFSQDMEPPPDPRRASAAGERHAEEISKILAETDVYVKYGLHQKAIDHLRRVFTLDDQNAEAHERLKDILISQGREQEAEAELLKLAELVAPADPDRAEQYLQELLAMNGTHTGAFELARRFRLRVARMSSVSAEVEYQGGGIAEIDPDGDELDLVSAPPPLARGKGTGSAPRRDSIDEFDPDELIGNRMAHGSPTPSRPPQRPQGAQDENFDVEFEPSPSQSTRQVPSDQVEALANMNVEELDDEGVVLVARPPSQGWNSSSTGFGGADAYDSAVDAEPVLDEVALAEDIDHNVEAELGATADPQADDMPFDPDEARRFDRDQLVVAGSYDPYGTDAALAAAHYEPTAMNTPVPADHEHVAVDQSDHVETPTPLGERAESLVEDDLDEADFYASQGMYPEALDALRVLLERHPNHRLILTKMREVEALEQGAALDPEAAVDTPPAGQHVDLQADHTGGTDAIELDEIEEVSADEYVEVDPDAVEADDSGGARAAGSKRKPTVMLEKPVDEGDAETHYDLGLAYKEMGLYDEAMKAFEKVLRAPGREVQCRVMLGMCQREQHNPSEAIHQFKQGLHANPSDRERLSLYYEIGQTYEQMGDDGEALYYFEAVLKRDPAFADTANRAEALRGRVGHPTPPPEDDL